MTAFFADTFYRVALTSTNDPAHERAMALSRSLTPEKIITTDDVLCEYLAFFADARAHVRFEAGEIVAELIEDPDMRVVPHSGETFLAGPRLHRARPDKGCGPVDCISMQTMRLGRLDGCLKPTTSILDRKGFMPCSEIPDNRPQLIRSRQVV